MKTKKLTLEKLKVRSFVTDVDELGALKAGGLLGDIIRKFSISTCSQGEPPAGISGGNTSCL